MATPAWAAGSPLRIPLPSPLPDSTLDTLKTGIAVTHASNGAKDGDGEISDQIEELEAENSILSRELEIQAAILLSQPSTSSAITSLPSHDARRKTLLAAVTAASLVLEENAYRMLAGITAFPVRDPDPHALDRGHVLGVRVDVCSDGRFKTPYFVFLQRAWPRRREWVKLAWHTIPPGVAVEAFAERYLPAPKWLDGDEEIRECCKRGSDFTKMKLEWKATIQRLEAAKKNAARRRVVELKRAAAVRKGAAFRKSAASRISAMKSAASLKSNIAIKRASPKVAGLAKSALLHGNTLSTPSIASQSSTGEMNVGRRRVPVVAGATTSQKPGSVATQGMASARSYGSDNAPSTGRRAASKQAHRRMSTDDPRTAGRPNASAVGKDHVCGPETPQDLPRFMRELRRELVAYNNRLSWVADMMEASGLDGDGTQNRFLQQENGQDEEEEHYKDTGNDNLSDDDEMYCYDSDESGSGEEPHPAASGRKRYGKSQMPIDENKSQAGSEDASSSALFGNQDSPQDSSNMSEPESDSDSSRSSAPDETQDEDTTASLLAPRPPPTRRAITQIRIMDPQVKWLRIEWADDRMGEVTMDDDGVVTKLVVLEQGSIDWQTTRRLLRNRELGMIRIEQLNRNLAGMVYKDLRKEVEDRARRQALGASEKRRRLA